MCEGKNKSRSSTRAADGATVCEKQNDMAVRRLRGLKKAEICNEEWNKTAVCFWFLKILIFEIFTVLIEVNLDIFIAGFLNHLKLQSVSTNLIVLPFTFFVSVSTFISPSYWTWMLIYWIKIQKTSCHSNYRLFRSKNPNIAFLQRRSHEIAWVLMGFEKNVLLLKKISTQGN